MADGWCDRCPDLAVETVIVELATLEVHLDLCSKHLAAALAGARPLPRGVRGRWDIDRIRDSRLHRSAVCKRRLAGPPARPDSS